MQKKKLLADLFEIVDISRTSADHHRDELNSLREFANYAKTLVQAEAPEFIPKFTQIMEHFHNALNAEERLVAAELRTAEDLNDVAARFEVVYRVSDETVEKTSYVKKCSSNIKALRDKLQDDLAKGGEKQHRIEADIQAAIEEKKKAIEAADIKLQEFISVKEKYNTFKVRRLQHAYVSYGEVLSTSMRELSEEYSKLSQESNVSNEELDSILEQGLPEVVPAEEQPKQE